MAELPQREITLIIIIGTTLILFLVGSIALFIAVYQRRILMEQERQKKLEREFQERMVQAQLQSQENERKRIAADLHDSVGSLLSGAKLSALFLERSIAMEGELKEAWSDLIFSFEQALVTVKRIAWELTPEGFSSLGLCESVKLLCERINGKGLLVAFSCNRPDVLLNDERALSVYRIIQELISNSLKHSQAKVLRVEISISEEKVSVTVQDDGIGFSLHGRGSGLGWWNIEQRAAQLKAKINIGTAPMRKGSLIQIDVPYFYANDERIHS
jgi:signal transduction histidine kinase